jgi:hypothetical protein
MGAITAHRRGGGAPVSFSAVQRAAAVPLLAGLLLVAPACTDGGHGSGHQAGPSAGGSATAPAASATVKVSVTHVAGRLRTADRAAVASRVRRLLSTYAAAAFVGGRYPRKDFSGAFSTFTTGAAEEARGDQALLTNADLGPTTRSVRLTRATAYVSVLAPRRNATGASAAIDWVFAVDRGDRAAQKVHLQGRLLLTKEKTGAWRIFGYDVNRSTTPSGGGS